MANLTFDVGTETSDWRVDLQDLLENGSLSPTVVATPVMTLTSGDYELVLTGVGLTASDHDTLTAGTITSFTLIDGTTTVLTMTGLTSADYTDLQSMLDGADGLDPTSTAFRDLVEPLMAGEALVVTGSSGDDVIYGSAFADTINAGEGSDQISGGAGTDQIDGQGGAHDEIRYDWETGTGGVDVHLADGGTDTFGDTDTLAGIEDGWGSAHDDFIVAIEGSSIVHAGGGYDLVSSEVTFGSGGWDFIDLGADGGRGVGPNSIITDTPSQTAIGLGDRADYYVVSDGHGNVGMIDLRAEDEGAQFIYGGFASFQFADGTLSYTQLTSDAPPETQYGQSSDDGGWTYGWHTAGGGTYLGWHYESGWDFGWYQNTWGFGFGSNDPGGYGFGGWAHGWYEHVGWEYGWYESGSWSLGAYYDYGGTGIGWNTGSVDGGSGGVEYGATPDLDTYGESYDLGGWEYGWFQSGAWVFGWHQEGGWDAGWYQTSGGWAIGWFFHEGWEYGWYETGTGQYGWHLDGGGVGIGWNSGASSGAYVGDEYAPSWAPSAWIVGWSRDVGGWETGWYQSGGGTAWGWHYESGWDYGWYESAAGWAWGWFAHHGWELGWFSYGGWTYGWHLDYGGLGLGWNLGADTGWQAGSEGPFAF